MPETVTAPAAPKINAKHYQYLQSDVFYDYEVLQNVSTLSLIFPKAKVVIIGVNTFTESVQPEIRDNKITVTPALLQAIRQRSIDVNRFELQLLNIKTRDVYVTDDFLLVVNLLIANLGRTNLQILAPQYNIAATLSNQGSIDKTHGNLSRWDRLLKMNQWVNRSQESFIDGYNFGFNSRNYDLAITVQILMMLNKDANARQMQAAQASNETALQPIDDLKIDTVALRQFSDSLILNHAPLYLKYGDGGWDLHKTIRSTGRFLDIQIINEKMRNAALKRLSAQKGLKILSSNNLSDDTSLLTSDQQLIDLVAYNLSDSLNTFLIFEDKAYQSPFLNRIQMIERYKDTQFKGAGITRDATSAKLIETVISPHEPLVDDAVLSMAYPITDQYDALGRCRKLLHPNSDLPLYDTFEEFNQHVMPIVKSLLDPVIVYKKVSPNTNLSYVKDQLERLVTTHPEIDHGGTVLNKAATVIAAPHQTDPALQFAAAANEQLVENGEAPIEILKDNNESLYLDPEVNDFLNQVKSLLFDDLSLATKDRLLNNALRTTANQIWNQKESKQPLTANQKAFVPYLGDFFYRQDPTTKQHPRRLVIKDNQIMFDLLEFMYREPKLRLAIRHGKRVINASEKLFGIADAVYRYIDAFRGKDLHDTEIYNKVSKNLPDDIKSGAIQLMPNNIPVALIIRLGGGHGTLINRERYEKDKEEITTYNHNWKVVRNYYAQLVIDNDDTPWTAGTSLDNLSESDQTEVISNAALLARLTKRDGFTHNEPQSIQDLEPSTFTSGTYKAAHFKRTLREKKVSDYTTTIDVLKAIHADISSYYPTLLCILNTFRLPNGKDPYREVRALRLEMKSKIKHKPSEWTAEEEEYNVVQTLMKLLLNSASGAGDATYDNNIRVNNKILRMRLCGQLIIDAISLLVSKHNGIPCSINTDGIYACNIDRKTMREQLDFWCELFQLDVDDLIVDRFISKDANNRMEITGGAVQEASGGTLSHYEGSNLTSNIALPTIVDTTLVNYLFKKSNVLDEPFDRDFAKQLLEDFISEKQAGNLTTPASRVAAILPFAHHITSNKSKHSYVVNQDNNGHWVFGNTTNRFFFVDPDLAVNDEDLSPHMTYARKIVIKTRPNTAASRNRNLPTFPTDEQPQGVNDREAYEAALHNNLLSADLPLYSTEEDRDEAAYLYGLQGHYQVQFNNINNLYPDDDFVMLNQYVGSITPTILDCLNLDRYIDLIKNQWEAWSKSHWTASLKQMQSLYPNALSNTLSKGIAG